MKKEKLKDVTDVIFVVCPNRECKKYYDEPRRPKIDEIPDNFVAWDCDGGCPWDCQHYIICPACHHKIFFDPKNNSRWARETCPHVTEILGAGRDTWRCDGYSFAKMSNCFLLKFKDEENGREDEKVYSL